MSSYVHKQAIRYRLPEEKANYLRDNDLLLESPFKDNSLFEYDFGLDWDNSKEEVYLDKIYIKEYDEMAGDFSRSRMLTKKEIERHLSDFQKYDSSIKAEDLRAIEICYYNGVDAPACYDINESSDEWIF